MADGDAGTSSAKNKENDLLKKPNKLIQGGIQVSSRQQENHILKSIRSVPWEFVDGLVPDYTMGSKACAFYLSVRYHTLNPNYIHERLKQVRI